MKAFLSKFKYVIALVIVAVALFWSISYICRHIDSSKKAETGRTGYEVVTAVPGVVFEVDSSLSEFATGVMEVSKNIDFVKNTTYSYQNNKDTYMQFNMNQYIVIACKGTGFNFKGNDVLDSLNNNSLNGIWFTNPTNITETDEKTTMDVEAQVIITNTVYNEFKGKLCTLNSEDDEWSLFVGSVNPRDPDMQDMIGYVTGTFVLNANNVADDRGTYEVTLSEDDKPTLRLVEARVPETMDAPVKAFTDVFGIEEEDSKDEKTAPSEDIEPAEEIEEPKEDVLEPSTQSPEEDIEIKEESSADIVEEEHVSMLVADSNQMSFEKDKDKAYTSSVYSMLSVGDTTFFENKDEFLDEYTEVYVKVTAWYSEKETRELIDEYIASGDAYYKEMEAPVGTHWEAIAFDVKCPENKDCLLNVRLLGLDGNDLVHRGVKYSKRTYNIKNKISYSDNWTKGYIVFYAVPTSCLEYSIGFGEKSFDGYYGAYYKITRGQKSEESNN